MVEQIRFKAQATAVKHDKEVDLTASFFFNVKGVRVEKSRLGLYRHLAHQLVVLDHHVRGWFLDLCKQHTPNPETARVQEAAVYRWNEDELEVFLENVYGKPLLENTKTVIWIDPLDECQNAHDTDTTSSEARIVLQFFGTLLDIAIQQGNSLDLCITGRSNLSFEPRQAWEIVVDQRNMTDISTYVSARLIIIDGYDQEQILGLGQDMLRNASSIFLWAKLIIDNLLYDVAGGWNLAFLRTRLDLLIKDFKMIYRNMIANQDTVDGDDRYLTVKFFHWVIFSQTCTTSRPASHPDFIQRPPPKSLRQWMQSEHCPDNDQQPDRRINHISRGLVEVTRDPDLDVSDKDSMEADASSIYSALGEMRIVQIVYETVREFFLEDGFSALKEVSPDGVSCFIKGHATVRISCFDSSKVRQLY